MENKSSETPIQRVLLDTNVISRIDSSPVGTQITLYLLDLIRRGFGLAISDITIYELLRGNSKEKEEKMLKHLDAFFRYFLTNSVLIAAAQLDNILKMENIQANSMDHGDKLIAATSILTGSLILTNNSRDFPWPLFHEAETKYINYKEGNKQKILVLALSRPDINYIGVKFTERP